MIRESDVNPAMIQRAVKELGVDVPIWGWRVEDGELVLVLAYGGEARWKPGAGTDVAGTSWGRRLSERRWRFVEGNRQVDAPAIPEGDLNALKKQQLMLLCQAWGYQTETLYPKKAEFVEALVWLRANNLGGG